MASFIILENEFRSLIRNSLENIIRGRLNNKYSKWLEILLKIVIRLVSSILAYHVYDYIKSYKVITSYIGIIIFFIFLINEKN